MRLGLGLGLRLGLELGSDYRMLFVRIRGVNGRVNGRGVGWVRVRVGVISVALARCGLGRGDAFY